jgi:transcriptional regulator with XRE-family HTH domain
MYNIQTVIISGERKGKMNEYSKKSFSQTLSDLRHSAGLSQRQAAADLGISQALLSHYENGAREPGLNFVCKVCDYYNVTADYILGRSHSPDGNDRGADVARAFVAQMRILANKTEAALEELT